ncbi:hypothetical protein ACQYRI_21335 [Salmonella enterica]
MIRNIFLPSGKTSLSRAPYILFYILLHIIYLTIVFNLDESPVPFLLCIIAFAFLKMNINAQRARDSGIKARYVVIPSLLVYFGAAIVGYAADEEYVNAAIKINNGFDCIVFLMLVLAPTQQKLNNQGMLEGERK